MKEFRSRARALIGHALIGMADGYEIRPQASCPALLVFFSTGHLQLARTCRLFVGSIQFASAASPTRPSL